MSRTIKVLFLSVFIWGTLAATAQRPDQNPHRVRISGKITSTDNEIINFASIYLKDTQMGGTTNASGEYHFGAPRGQYTLVVSAMGYETVEMPVTLNAREHRFNVEIKPEAQQIESVVVSANGVERINKSAYNVIAVDAKSLHNSTLDLAHAMARVPGVKLRESGGVGSDLKFSLDGFSGRHVKFFMDGVPMEGIGSSFAINNIPINYADRIEIYKGVVPVGFGADALGGVVNIITNQTHLKTTLDASYSYGSFNTHKSYVNFSHRLNNGIFFDVNAFQNYSDNNYKITQNEITNFEWTENNGGSWKQSANAELYETVKRFHDTYHNETIGAKVGIVGKSWADRLILGVTLSQSDKEIQNGVKQAIVYGDKRTKAKSVMPSFQYLKRDLFTEGLDVNLTANYNFNKTHNIDTGTYKYNWRGESIPTGSLGEQTYQDATFKNDNWNGTFNANYRIGDMHGFTLNHVISGFDRKATENSTANGSSSAAIPKSSRKNITGLSYRISVDQVWNLSVFGKYYNQSSKGAMNISTTGGENYEKSSKDVSSLGYGAAGTYFWKDFQAKLSYEHAYRLPTNDEMFGDEDLEKGAGDLKPEESNNYNINLNYGKNFGSHAIFVEAGYLYRYTENYIRRTLEIYSGGLNYGINSNHGKVETKGFNLGVRYNYTDRLTIGGSLTSQDIRNDERYTAADVAKESTTYRQRMPNMPYFFYNCDASYYFYDLGAKGNVLTVTYDNLYVKEFPLYWADHGSTNKKVVDSQFSHNLSLVYSMKNGKYNFSLECRNFTNEKVYDNYSLQKAGRGFYGKIRYFFGK